MTENHITKPKVSVIIPVYNREKTIRFCLESVKNCYEKNIEIIVINDGSTDKSLEIINEISSDDNRIKVISVENKGVSNARNIGLENTSGKWICFVDSDDCVAPYIFDELSLEEVNDIDLYMHSYSGFREKDKKLVPKKDKNQKKIMLIDTPVDFFYKNTNPNKRFMFSSCDKLFRNSIIKNNKIKFDVECNLGEDQIFICQYLEYCHKMIFSFSCSYYTIRWENITHLGSKQRNPSDYFANQKKNYNALNQLFIKTTNQKVHEYAINYIFDRPFTRFIFPCKNNLKSIYDYAKNEVLPFLELCFDEKVKFTDKNILKAYFLLKNDEINKLIKLINKISINKQIKKIFYFPIKVFKYLLKRISK